MMNMISPFRPLIDREYVEKLEEIKTASAVAHVLEGKPLPSPPEYTGSSVSDLAKHRIAEIDRSYDPAWPELRDVVWLGAHHAREAATRAESFADHWALNCESGGWTKQPRAVRRMVASLRDRVDPALHVAKKEFDPTGQLETKYDELEAAINARVDEIERRYAEDRAGASAHSRQKLRQQEGKELQRVLDDLAEGMRSWADAYPKNRKALIT